MSRRNKTEFALLGLLSLRPMSGYDVKATISTSIGFFWQESYGQIYPALKRLSKERLVSRRTEQTPGRPDRHVYSITQKGRDRLTEWLKEPVANEPVRNELLLKLFFGLEIPRGTCSRHIEEFLRTQVDMLRAFQGVKTGVLEKYQGDPSYPYWESTLKFGMYVTQARIRWCKDTLAWLKEDRAVGARRRSRR